MANEDSKVLPGTVQSDTTLWMLKSINSVTIAYKNYYITISYTN